MTCRREPKIVSASGEIPLDMCFKEFVEKIGGMRLRDVAHGTVLYRSLLEEFNRGKRLSLDTEDREMRRAARALAATDQVCPDHPSFQRRDSLLEQGLPYCRGAIFLSTLGLRPSRMVHLRSV